MTRRFSSWCRVAAVAVLSAASIAASGGTLRICADPDNLPFSKSDGPERGMYVELADLVSKRLGDSPEFVWWLSYNQRKSLRLTIQQDGCDAYFALPAADYPVRGLAKTHAFLQVGYAAVGPKGLQLRGLDDLRGKRIGVLHGSPPHILLAARDGFTTTSFREHGEAMAALAKGEVDVALLWGPVAGYENQRRWDNRFAVIPVTGEGLGGGVAVAVRKQPEGLAGRIDQALTDLQPQIRELAQKYGFPLAAPVPLSSAKAVPGTQVAATWRPVATAPADTRAMGAAPDSAAMAQQGRTFFNNSCSHCHGTDAATAISERDLRKLSKRYKDDWRGVAVKTIKEGRPDAGMPTWKDALNDKQIEELIAFLQTIQR